MNRARRDYYPLLARADDALHINVRETRLGGSFKEYLHTAIINTSE